MQADLSDSAFPQDAGMILLSMGDGILTHLPKVSRPNIRFRCTFFLVVHHNLAIYNYIKKLSLIINMFVLKREHKQ
jgi:hypothetical protein